MAGTMRNMALLRGVRLLCPLHDLFFNGFATTNVVGDMPWATLPVTVTFRAGESDEATVDPDVYIQKAISACKQACADAGKNGKRGFRRVSPLAHPGKGGATA